MDQPVSSQDPSPTSTTENPIVAVGRKVKSVLSTSQRPSVRIVPESKGTRKIPTAAQGPESRAEPNASENANSLTRIGGSVRSLFGRRDNATEEESFRDEYDPDTVDLLDVMDPEVSTLSTLTNVQNSLFVPSLGKVVNRRATYRISEPPREARLIDQLKASLKRISSKLEEVDEKRSERKLEGLMSNLQYAVVPDDAILDGWTRENFEELDDRVRHELHSRRAHFKRSMKGFRQYVRRPLGLFVTVYATLITLFGAAWVLFLIGWISVGSKRDYVINVVDNVLVALFAIIGDGLAPFRAVDTYHMIYIAYYHRKTWRKREKLGLPRLVDHNDLPDLRKEEIQPKNVDLESLVARKMPRRLARRVAPRIPKKLARRIVTRSKTNDNPSYEYSVLTKEQQAKLEFHERKFSKSHTFYKPHETETHYAFPLKLLVAVVLLLDCHSALQITLGACTWGIPYKTRPFALTTVILCCSITCNITGGVLISVGDRRTRKKDVIERIMRQELTADAIQQMETRWMKEAEERGELDKSVRKKIEDEREGAENEEVKKAWKSVPMLPKKLLGKGEDHRQPPLPQQARKAGSSSTSLASSSSSTPKKSGYRSGAALPPLQEDSAQLSRPNQALTRDKEAHNEGTGQKILRLIRRADMDRS